jgi:hypothetical protein
VITSPRTRSIWLALLACVLLALVPANGVILCFTADGSVHVEFDASGTCPCPLDPDGEHPPCVDVVLDGTRDRLPPSVVPPIPEPIDWLPPGMFEPVAELAWIQPEPPLDSVSYGWPPGASPTRPPRALAERAVVVLLI